MVAGVSDGAPGVPAGGLLLGATIAGPNVPTTSRVTKHYGLTGGWVQKFKCSYLL